MIVTCPECATRYAVDDAAFQSGGRAVRCAHCACEWYQIGSNTPADRPADPSAFPMSMDDDAAAAAVRPPPQRFSASRHVQAARRSLAGGGAEEGPPARRFAEIDAAEETFERQAFERETYDGGMSAREAAGRSNGRDPGAATTVDRFGIEEEEYERARAALGVGRAEARSASGDRLPRTRIPAGPLPADSFASEGFAADSAATDDFLGEHRVSEEYAPAPSRPAAAEYEAAEYPENGFDAGHGGLVRNAAPAPVYDRSLTPAVAAAARRETARTGGVVHRTTAFGRADGALRRPTRSRRRAAQLRDRDDAAFDEAPLADSPHDGALRRPAAEEPPLFDPSAAKRARRPLPEAGLDAPSEAPRRRPARRRGLARLALVASIVGGGLFVAYALGPQLAEVAPATAPAVDAYRDRINAVLSNPKGAERGQVSGLVFVEFEYNLVERAEGPALEVWGRVANNGDQPVLTPTIEIVSRNAEGDALQRWLAHPEVDKLEVGESARFTSRMMYPLGPVTDVDFYIASR